MAQKSNKIFNEKKYQKNRKALNYIGMLVVILSIVVGGFVMYLGYKFVGGLTADFSTSSSTSNNNSSDKKVILTDGSLVAVPKTKDELQAAYAKVDEQYPNIELGEEGYSSEDYSANNSDKSDLKVAYDSYIRDQQNNSSDFMSNFNSTRNFIKSTQKAMFTLMSFIPGLIIMIIGISIGSKILVVANGRGILGFFAQSTVPVFTESFKKTAKDVSPTIINIGKRAGKAMAPVYGDVAKEIAKGIKGGWASTNGKKSGNKKARK